MGLSVLEEGWRMSVVDFAKAMLQALPSDPPSPSSAEPLHDANTLDSPWLCGGESVAAMHKISRIWPLRGCK